MMGIQREMLSEHGLDNAVFQHVGDSGSNLMARQGTKMPQKIEGEAIPSRSDISAISDDDPTLRNSPTAARQMHGLKGVSRAGDKHPSPRNAGNDKLNNRMFFRLFQIANELQRKSVQQLGISTVQWAVLGALSQDRFAAGIPFGQLGDYLVVTRQNLDGVIKRLERDGLVRRVADNEDKRARLVQLTDLGKVYWEETLARIYQFYDQATAAFSFDDRVAFIYYINALQKELTKVDLPKSGLPKRNKS